MDAQAREAWLRGDFAEAQALFEQVLQAQRAEGSVPDIIYALIHVVQSMRLTDGFDPDSAAALLAEALELAESLDSERHLTVVRANLADLALSRGEYAETLEAAKQLIRVWRTFPDPDGLCAMIELTAKALIGLGRPAEGLRLYAAATATRTARGTQHTVGAYLAAEERFLAQARSQLGAAASAETEAAGARLELERAATEAMNA